MEVQRRSWEVMEPDGRLGLSDQVCLEGVFKHLDTIYYGLD